MQLPLHTLQDQLFNADPLPLYMLTLFMLTLYKHTIYMLTLYMLTLYIYAHLIYEVHSADSETDKGALHQPEKPNSGEIQPFNQKGRRMIKGFEAKLLQKVRLLAPKVLLEDL